MSNKASLIRCQTLPSHSNQSIALGYKPLAGFYMMEMWVFNALMSITIEAYKLCTISL